jgi:multidrug efflux pump subunit AcrA (membrane-fusion protein)
MSSPATKHVITVGVAMLAVAGLGLAYSGRLFGSAPRPGVSVTGTVEATQVDVSVKIVGRIVARLVNEGDRVAQGQLLVRLDDSELGADVQRQNAALLTAEATLRDLLAGPRAEEIKEARATVARARAQLADLLAGSRPQEIEDARAAVRSAEATRNLKERDLARTEKLYRQDLVAQQDVDRAREASDVATALARSARERLAMAEEGPRRNQIEAARADLAAAEQRLALLLAGSRPEQIAVARGQLAQARSALAMAESRLKEATVTAPIAGIVLRKNMDIGETANPGVSILTLMNPGDMWVRAFVPEEQIGRIRLGSPGHVTVDAYPGRTFVGRVSEIGSEAEFTPKNVQTKKERVNLVFRMKIMIDDRDGILKPGMPADVDIDAGAH